MAMKTDNSYILMLEDDTDDQHITETFFAEKGYSIGIEFLSTSDDVLPFLESCLSTGRKLPGLILLDKNVPAGNGMDALRQIKTHDVFRIIPVVMISGTAYPADIREAYQIGVNSFITKPFYHQDTVKTIEGFVSYWFDIAELPENSVTEIPANRSN